MDGTMITQCSLYWVPSGQAEVRQMIMLLGQPQLEDLPSIW